MILSTPTPSAGFAPAPVDSTQWNAQVVEDAAKAQQQDITYRASNPATDSSWIPDWIKTPVEWVGSKMHDIYSATISRPLATALMAPEIALGTGNTNPFSSETWDRAYQDSSHVSPGQALEFGLQHFFDTNDEVRQALMKPVNYQPKDIFGKPAADSTGKPIIQNLNQTGILWDNPQAVQQHFDSGIQKWISGGLDAATSWYVDPFALAGKSLGAARNFAYVRPAAETANQNIFGAAAAKLTGGAIGVPKTTNNITKNLESSAFNSMGDLIMKQKSKLSAVQGPVLQGAAPLGGDTFTDWVSRQNWAKNSSDSGALAAQLGKAADRTQVDQILSISLGDEVARQALTAKNAELGAMTTMLTRQREGLISNFPANPNPGQAAIHAQQLQDISDQLTGIDRQTSSISAKLNLANSMKSGMYFNPTLSPIASNMGQYVRSLTPMKASESGIGMSLLYNNLYVRPLRVVTGATWGAVRAPGHIDLFDSESHRAFDASIDQSKVYTPAERQELVSKYIGLDGNSRGTYLDVVDRNTVGRIAQKYNLTDEQASAIYNQLGGMKGAARDGRIYSTARIDTASGGSIRADHVDDAGNIIAVSPVLNTQLENTHILTDYEHFNNVLKYNAASFKRLFNEQQIQARAAQNGPLSMAQMQQAQTAAIGGVSGTATARIQQGLQVGKDMADLMGHMWKFNVLMRLGYGPRAIADDFMGQAARFGSWTTFGERMVGGGRNNALRNWNKALNDPTGYEQQISSLDSGINILTERSQKFQDKIDTINSYLPPAKNYTGLGAQGRRQMNQRTSTLAAYQQRLDDTQTSLEALKAQRNKIGETKNRLGDNYIIMPDGTAFPRPYEGPNGALFRDLNTGRKTIDSIMGGTSSDIWNAYRSGDWRTITSAEPGHSAAWLKDVQYQIANDKAAMQVVKGKNAQQLEAWFGTQEGRQYRRESAMNNMSDADHADRIAAHVNMYLPTHTPEAMALRQTVAEGADDKTVAAAMSKVDQVDRPDVQSEGLSYAMGKSDAIKGMNSAINKFYNVMNRLPAEVLSRNPLFFQLYRQHVSEMWSGAMDQGITHLTPLRQQQMAETARQLALKDVKKFTFNMDFETKLAHNMRFLSPFFGPMQESFTRWGRILADKPEILSHANNIYTAPIHAGHAVDAQGNPVDQDGYVHNADGSKTLVSKADMHIQFQVPTWAQKGLGLDGGTMVNMPINTLNLVLQNDPWYNPGVGPWVQLPANYAALRSNPTVGDTLKQLGILQSVQQNTLSQLTGAAPKFLNQLITDDPAQQQKDMIQIMQAEDYKYKNGMRPTEPTWQEVKDKASHGALMRSFMKTILPVSASFKDPYQFFRDRYQELQQADPKTADQIYLAKYGEAAFAFTGALSKSGKGLPSTAEAVMADKKYSYLTDKFPELASLIVGPYGEGQFSQTAYTQQLASGDRVKLTAQQSMDSAKANLGWAMFGKYMNQVTASLYQAGFTSFQDKGAQQYNNQRKAIISMLTSPTLPNGQINKMYNDQFDKAYNTVDRTKYDRQADALRQVVTEGSLVRDPLRSDIRSLSQYLVYRSAMKTVLGARGQQAGGSADINAKQNADLKTIFEGVTMNLIQNDTQFQSLHDRFLVHDMFNHYDPALTSAVGG
jgi:hypothetical protein